MTRKAMSKNLMIFKSNGKEGGALSFGGKRSCLKKKKIRAYDTGKEGGESSHSFAK